MNNNEDLKHLMDKVKEVEKNEKLDLSSDEDLSIGIMNLISIEEHLFFSGAKTGKPEYYDLLNEVRQIRKDLLKKIIKDYEGEVWCISKHLLAGSMRLMEVGTKYLGKGDKTQASDLFDKAYKLYSLFWGLNLGIISTSNMSAEASTSDKLEENKEQIKGEGEIKFINEDAKPQEKTASSSVLDKLGKIVQKAIDCCRE